MQKNPKKTRRRIVTLILAILLIVILLCGLSAMMAPYQDYVETKQEIQQQIAIFRDMVATYQENTSDQDDPDGDNSASLHSPRYFTDLWDAFQEYNSYILETGQKDLVDAFSYENEVFDLAEFNIPEGCAGILSIPDINVEMPIYLGCNRSNLSKGFAQMSQTSMPTGGTGTNCVLAGHRGYYGLPYMRDVEQLETGDRIYLQNYWEILEYEITDIMYVDPYRTDVLKIQEDKDLLTIVTCHPYGVGSHRIIVVCERINETEEITEIPEATTESWFRRWTYTVFLTKDDLGDFESSQAMIFVTEFLPWIILLLLLILVVLFVLFWLIRFFWRKIRRRKKDRTT